MKNTVKDLRKKSASDLVKDADAIRKEIAKMTMEAGVNPVKDTNSIVKKRIQLAVILTVASEKKEEKVSKSEAK